MTSASTIDIVDEQLAVRIAALFAVLADASRVRIIATLFGREFSVGELSERVGLSQSAVSHHLRHLRQMRLVRAQRDGRHVYYRLDDAHIEAIFRCGLEHVSHE